MNGQRVEIAAYTVGSSHNCHTLLIQSSHGPFLRSGTIAGMKQHHYRTASTALMFLTAAVVLGASTLLTAQIESSPDLTGVWILSPTLSDRTPPDGVAEGGERSGGPPPPTGGGMGPGRGGRGFPGGGRGGTPGGLGGEREMPNPDERERTRAAMEAAMHVPTRLTIVRSESGLIVTDEQGVTTRIPLNGKKDTGAANGVPFETSAKWEHGRLRVERKFKGGVKVIEHLSVAAEPKLLTVSVKIEGRGGRTSTRAYEPLPLAK